MLWVLEKKTIQVRRSGHAIATRDFELRELKQRVAAVRRKRVFHYHPPIIALGVGARRSERCAPIERLAVLWSIRRRRRDHRVDENATSRAAAARYELARAREHGIRLRLRRRDAGR